MAEEKGEKGVREILRSAESNSDASQLSGKSLLTKSLDEAIQSLKVNFDYDNPFNPAGSDSADYDKMFAAIAENFSQLSKELSRSGAMPVTWTKLNQVDFNSTDNLLLLLYASSSKVTTSTFVENFHQLNFVLKQLKEEDQSSSKTEKLVQ